MAFGYQLEAQYESGYVHREDEQDHSPFVRGANIFNDILNNRPNKAHGKMTRWSIIGKGDRYDIDWTTLPDNARPIYYRDMKRVQHLNTGDVEISAEAHHFGYQFTDKNGKNKQEVIDLL